jgi:tetratricopeptide (TPR) repeat protein
MLRRLLAKLLHRKPAPGSIAHEKWESTFTRGKNRRFQVVDTDRYAARNERGFFRLQLRRSRHFAWVLNEMYRYRNFVLDLDIEFGEENGHSAAGAVFRYVNEENYYYALISNHGYFRLDVVFNGNPITLIPWLEIPLQEERFLMRVIAHNDNLSFYLDKEWIAEIDDETVASGYVGFAAQNYEERDHAELRFNRVALESRPVEVEVLYYRWTRFIHPDPERRITLARRLFGFEQYTAALIQLRRAFADREPTAEEHFFTAECQLNLRLYDSALQEVEAALEIDPEYREARLEKANLLYLQNRFLEDKEYLGEIIDDFPENAVLHNLFGNVEFALGNWNEAAERYLWARELEPEMPIFTLNAARAFDNAGRDEKAAELYTAAARLFFRQEGLDDLPPIFARMAELDPENPEIIALRGKTAFQQGDFSRARMFFDRLIERGEERSDIYFLRGVLQVREGAWESAAASLGRAVELEPAEALYWMKLAEARYHAGEDPGEALERARELDPENGWIFNLAGLIDLEEGRPEEAEAHLHRAYETLSGESEVLLNYSQVLHSLYGLEEALRIFPDDEEIGAALANQKGNLFAAEQRFEDALTWYRRAVSEEPENPVFLENIAALLFEMEQINEAEDYLRKLLELHPTARGYALMARIAAEKGELSRAEQAYREALRSDSGAVWVRIELAEVLYRFGRWQEALEHAEAAYGSEAEARAREFVTRVREEHEIRYQCSKCGREWWVPKDIPEQSRVRLHGEPSGESPAGRCPSCGNVYCVACAMEHMEESRFVCLNCGERLKLNDDGLKYLVMRYVRGEEEEQRGNVHP